MEEQEFDIYMSVFQRIHCIQTLTTEENPEAMLFGITQATDLLDEYAKSEWVCHPDVSAAMVLASLQKDGLGIITVAGTVAKHTLQSLRDLQVVSLVTWWGERGRRT